MALQSLIKKEAPILNMGHPLAANLQFDAPLWEGAGLKTMNAVSPNSALAGTFKGTTTPSWGKGFMGTKLNFNGTTAYLDFLNTSLVDITGTKLTVQVIVTWPSATTGIIIAKPQADGSHSAPYFHYSIHWINSTSARFWVDTDSNAGVSTSDTALSLTVGVTYVITGTYDGANLRIYQDGILKNTTACSGSVSSTNTPLRLGANGAPGEYWNGDIYCARVWRRCLTATEVKDLSANPWMIYI